MRLCAAVRVLAGEGDDGLVGAFAFLQVGLDRVVVLGPPARFERHAEVEPTSNDAVDARAFASL